jgi:excinuclease ABC subunit A
VVVVEHEEAFVAAADELVDIGPGAGKNGGRIIYQGAPAGVANAPESLTGAHTRIPLPLREGPGEGQGARVLTTRNRDRRPPTSGSLILTGARQHNLKNLTVEFPLQMLCAVTGVSGSGKSTLVEQTLYPALCRRLGQPCDVEAAGEFDGIAGVENIDEVIRVDQSPIGRAPRSNAATYMNVFGEIRALFASTNEAKLRNFTATAFSFNAAGGGRCGKCLGSGTIEIDMQFLPDITMTCPECGGTRFRREIVEVKYRGLNIAEVLNLTVQEAFSFFRNHSRVLKKLKFLKDVGLDYLALGQPANTLSGGESQRLKIASFLALGSRSRTLFLIDEPTAGLHAADVARLLECFESLLAVGHSLIVVEHHLDVIAAADHVVDLGPEAGENGGNIVAAGTPEEIADCDASITGRFLREVL